MLFNSSPAYSVYFLLRKTKTGASGGTDMQAFFPIRAFRSRKATNLCAFSQNRKAGALILLTTTLFLAPFYHRQQASRSLAPRQSAGAAE
jgi:hypothetical protein